MKAMLEAHYGQSLAAVGRAARIHALPSLGF